MNALATLNEVHDDVNISDVMSTSHDQLADMSSKLGKFLAGSESVFLQTGDRLQGLANRANEIVHSSKTATTLETGTGADDPVHDLAHTLAIMEQHLTASREAANLGTNGLVQVLTGIDSLTNAGEEFQRIATTLKVLATSLRVEDGRRAAGFGFDSVSQDVLRLGKQIATNFDAIVNRCMKLRGVAMAARTNEREFLSRQGTQTGGLLSEARESLTALSELEQASAVVRGQAASTSARIGTQVTSILVALQTHDITRQMIEHVVEAIESFAAEEAPGEESSTAEEYLADLSHLCRIQSGQVQKARQDLVDAQTRIAQALRELSGDVEGIFKGTQHLTDGSKQGESLLTSVERRLNQAAQLLHQQVTQEQGMFAALQAVADSAKDMEGFVGQIAVIANDVKVVALNALVKAVKTGSEGAVFAVLARTIQELSVGVAEKTTWVSQVMGEMLDMAQGLNQTTSERIEGESIEAQLDRLVGALRHYQEGVLSSLTEVRNGSIAIGNEVKEINNKLARQARAADDLFAIEKELQIMADQTGTLAGSALQLRKSRWTEAATERYTMESERIVHQTVTRSADGDEPPASSAGKSDLGSNVELF